jgi:S-adenosylmethionine-diacylgycerolhomoserine-N-methlytransferase
VIFSYALSMIPDWRAAMGQACAVTAPGGAVHIVDFGAGQGMAPWARRALWTWLARFHVTPRVELADHAQTLARHHGGSCVVRAGAFDYFQHIVIRMPG